MMVNLGTTNLLLAVMAAVSIIEVICLIGAVHGTPKAGDALRVCHVAAGSPPLARHTGFGCGRLDGRG
jgi:hypothetical protein